MNLSMKEEHFYTLKSRIESLDTLELRDKFRSRDFPNAHLTRDLDMRYRWELFYLAGLDYNALWNYLDNNHIDAALKQIVQPLS